jgi:hypothetical protein
MTYLPNNLNDYETYTYNIRMYVANPSYIQDLDFAIAQGNALLLADNVQISKYNINSFEQVFTVGHGQVREGIGNKFEVKIAEPNGATLLNRIKGLCNNLGITDHIRAGYIFAIDFHGRLADGNPKKFPQTFYYAATIQQMDFKIDNGGTNYNISLVENGMIGQYYNANVILSQIVVVAETVGEFITQFVERLNEAKTQAWRLNRSLSSGLEPDNYNITFDETTEDWRRWRFEILDADFEVDGVNFVGVPGQNPKLQVTATAGTNITSLMGQVLQLTSEYKRILVNTNGSITGKTARQKPEESTTSNLDEFPVFFKMISNVKYNTYDEFRGDYQRTYEYKLKAYTVTDEILDSRQYLSSITNPGIQRARLQNLISGNFLRKRYDYIYTGLNTEVLNLDMQFDFAYYQITPFGDGYLGDADLQAPKISEAGQAGFASVEVDLANAKRQQAIAQSAFNREVRTNAQVGVGSTLTNLVNSVTNFDVQVGVTRDIFQNEYQYAPGDVQYLVRWAEDVISDSDTYGSDNNTKSGTLKMGAVKANLENSGDMMVIEMEIRGDPYWMGKPNSFFNQQSSIEDIADYEAGAPSFFLNVNLPVSDEDEGGRRKPSPDYQLTGLYRVRSVINRFQGGQFVQYLEAIRDVATNVSTIYDTLAGDTSTMDAQRAALTRQQNIDIAQRIEDARTGGPTRF